MAEKQSSFIQVKNINSGGIAESIFQGPPNSVAEAVGLDLHSVPGEIRVNQAPVKASSTVVTEFCKVSIALSTGQVLFFSSSSGKIWLEGSPYTLLDTTAPTNGSAGCSGACEYDGYLYWATQNYTHRIRIDKIATFSTDKEENWGELHLDQEEMGGTGQSYTLQTSVNEGETHKIPINFHERIQYGIGIQVLAKGTGDWTITLHDEDNNSITSKTITNASLANGWNYLLWTTQLTVDRSLNYHIHIHSTVADGTMNTLTGNDLAQGSVKIFTLGDPDYHQMKIQNQTLYLADRHYIHQVGENEGVHIFTNWALDLTEPHRIKCLGKSPGTDLIIGTHVDNGVEEVQVAVWDTFSEAPIFIDPVKERSIHTFLELDNGLLAIAGDRGRVYEYNNYRLQKRKSIPGEYSPSKYVTVHPEAGTVLDGLPIWGVSNGTGNPCKQGVYSYGSKNPAYPFILNLEFVISERSGSDFVTSNIEIGSLLAKGNDLYITWKNGSSYGVDKLDYNTKLNGAYFTTRALFISRIYRDVFKNIYLPYKSLPANTNIGVQKSIRYGSYSSWNDVRNDTDNYMMVSHNEEKANIMQIKVSFTTSGNNAPILEELLVEIA
jgi:hypothetical protein